MSWGGEVYDAITKTQGMFLIFTLIFLALLNSLG